MTSDTQQVIELTELIEEGASGRSHDAASAETASLSQAPADAKDGADQISALLTPLFGRIRALEESLESGAAPVSQTGPVLTNQIAAALAPVLQRVESLEGQLAAARKPAEKTVAASAPAADAIDARVNVLYTPLCGRVRALEEKLESAPADASSAFASGIASALQELEAFEERLSGMASRLEAAEDNLGRRGAGAVRLDACEDMEDCERRLDELERKTGGNGAAQNISSLEERLAAVASRLEAAEDDLARQSAGAVRLEAREDMVLEGFERRLDTLEQKDAQAGRAQEETAALRASLKTLSDRLDSIEESVQVLAQRVDAAEQAAPDTEQLEENIRRIFTGDIIALKKEAGWLRSESEAATYRLMQVEEKMGRLDRSVVEAMVESSLDAVRGQADASQSRLDSAEARLAGLEEARSAQDALTERLRACEEQLSEDALEKTVARTCARILREEIRALLAGRGRS